MPCLALLPVVGLQPNTDHPTSPESHDLVRFCQTEPSAASLAFFGKDPTSDNPKPRHVMRVYEAVHELKVELDKTSRELQRQRAVNKSLKDKKTAPTTATDAEKRQVVERGIETGSGQRGLPTVPLAPADAELGRELEALKEQLAQERAINERQAAGMAALNSDMEGLVKERENIRRQLTRSEEALKRLQAAHNEQTHASDPTSKSAGTSGAALDPHLRKSQSFPVQVVERGGPIPPLAHSKSMMAVGGASTTSFAADAAAEPASATRGEPALTSSQRSIVQAPTPPDQLAQAGKPTGGDEIEGEDGPLPPGWQIEIFQGSKLYVNHELKSFSWVHPGEIATQSPAPGDESPSGAVASPQAAVSLSPRGDRHGERAGQPSSLGGSYRGESSDQSWGSMLGTPQDRLELRNSRPLQGGSRVSVPVSSLQG
jgi:hypothetical protein